MLLFQVHTDLSRSSIRSSDGEYQYYQVVGRFPGDSLPHLSIPPPPSTPPPPIPKGSYGGHENADVTSLESNTSTSSQSDVPDYENLKPGELESIMQMQAAIKSASKGGPPNTPPSHTSTPRNGHNNMSQAYGNTIYGNYILMQRNPRPGTGHLTSRSAPLKRSNAISIPGSSRPVLTRYNAISQPAHTHTDNDSHAHRISATPKLKQISEKDSEAGSKQASLDALDTPTNNGHAQENPASRPTDIPVSSSQSETPTHGATPTHIPATPTASSAPPTPAAPPVPPAPPLPPPGTFTPPTNSLRWKKMA